MADRLPSPLPGLTGVAVPGRYGRAIGPVGVTARELIGFGLASVSTGRDCVAAVAEAVNASFAVALPSEPRRVDGPRLSMIWSGPEQWLVLCPRTPENGMEAMLSSVLDGHASITDQSHSRILLRVSGLRVRDTLAKGIAIDLDPREFRPGDTAMTQVAHFGVQLWQVDRAPTYDIVAFRSYAHSLWRWLDLSAAEFGLEFLPPGLMEDTEDWGKGGGRGGQQGR